MKYKNFLKDHGNLNIHFKDGYYISLNELYQAFEEERKEPIRMISLQVSPDRLAD